MHCHTPLGRIVKFLVILLLSISGIIVGLKALNYDVLQSTFAQTKLLPYMKPIQIAIGIAGVLGIISLLSCLFFSSKCEYCSKCKSCEAPHSHGRSHSHR